MSSALGGTPDFRIAVLTPISRALSLDVAASYFIALEGWKSRCKNRFHPFELRVLNF